jgi:ubiquinone/menaquinone biosynthesis C-methylase UbiE
MKIESIPAPGAYVYGWIARKSPPLQDLCNAVAAEVTAAITAGRILDVGTGPGYLPIEIATRTPNLELDGIDLSPAMVKLARNTAARKGVADRVRFQRAHAADLPFDDRSFDLVISTLSFHHWARPLECLAELHRVLKPHREARIYDARRDTTDEVNAAFRREYGRFVAFLFLTLVRAHSSVPLHEFEALLASPELRFANAAIIDRGVFLKLQLVK